jgi:WD40 repeat protein
MNLKQCFSASISLDNEYCITIGRDVNCWSIRENKKIWCVHPLSNPSNCALSPDSKYIVVKNTQGNIVVLNTEDGAKQESFISKSYGEGSNIEYSTDGKCIIDGSWNGSVIIRDSMTGSLINRYVFTNEMIERVHKVNNGETWFTEHQVKAVDNRPLEDVYLLKWIYPLGSVKPTKIHLGIPSIQYSAITNNCRYLAIVSGTKKIELLVNNFIKNRIIWRKEIECGGSGFSLKWSYDDKYLGSVQKEKIMIYNGINGEIVNQYDIKYPSEIYFASSNKYIVLCSWENGIIQSFSI